MCLWEFLRVTIGTCVFCADGIMITNNSNNYHVFLNVFMFRIMSMTLRNINPQKENFHHYDFPVYTTSKYRDPKLDTFRRITLLPKYQIFTKLHQISHFHNIVIFSVYRRVARGGGSGGSRPPLKIQKKKKKRGRERERGREEGEGGENP